MNILLFLGFLSFNGDFEDSTGKCEIKKCFKNSFLGALKFNFSPGIRFRLYNPLFR